MKSIFLGLMVCAGVLLYSCGGNSGTGNNDTNAASNEDNSGASSESNAAIDINAPSTSKGVGKFTDVKVGGTIDKSMAEKGEEVFQTKCTVCHQATDQKLIGPGLKGITEIRTPEWIMNMITDPDKMVQNDPVAKAVYEEYNQTQMTNQGLTDQEARAVLEYLRQNDAQ